MESKMSESDESARPRPSSHRCRAFACPEIVPNDAERCAEHSKPLLDQIEELARRLDTRHAEPTDLVVTSKRLRELVAEARREGAGK